MFGFAPIILNAHTDYEDKREKIRYVFIRDVLANFFEDFHHFFEISYFPPFDKGSDCKFEFPL